MRLTDYLDKGASLGVSVMVTDSIKTRLNWFYSHEHDTSYSYTDKAWFNGQGSGAGTPGAPYTPLPGIDPTMPYSIDANGVVQNATFNANGAETARLGFRQQAHGRYSADRFRRASCISPAMKSNSTRYSSPIRATESSVTCWARRI